MQKARPAGLPEQSPGSDMLPVRDSVCTGKGRGGQMAGLGNFETPPSSKLQGRVPGGRGVGAKCPEGKMPDEGFHSLGAGAMDDRPKQPVDELQRALEFEIVNHLLEQNAKLMTELEWYRNQRFKSDCGMGSNTSWVEVATGERDQRPAGSCGNGGSNNVDCKTPRGDTATGRVFRCTPNGTRIPDGTLPDDGPSVEPPVELPPVPPFPCMGGENDFKSLDHYEMSDAVPKVRCGDRQWKPACERGHEPILAPGEARAFWLEREVASLKHTLSSMVDPFQDSDYWNGRFQPSSSRVQGHSKSGLFPPGATEPVDTWDVLILA